MPPPSVVDRRNAWLTIAGSIVRSCVARLPCMPQWPTDQYVDVRVRNPNGNLPIVGVMVTVTDLGGFIATAATDVAGDVIIHVPTPGAYDVSTELDWHVPQPSQQVGVNAVVHDLTVVALGLEPLLYHLHVDADRDGNIDPAPAGVGGIQPWTWGPGGSGAIILCNNDHDDGLPQAQRQRDNADNAVNANPDTNEIARIEIRRTGPATAPPAGWTATLDILGGNEDKIRIFAGPIAADAQLLGAGVGGAAANAQHVFQLRTGAPASFAGQVLGVEAVSYPRQGFTGLVRIRLTVAPGGGPEAPYTTSAELRVAPWMIPNHLDAARRVYVVDKGVDTPIGLAVPDGLNGNATFRNTLGIEVAAAGIALPDYRQIANPTDIWMQDCMEIGYSVFPNNGTRHRVEAALQMYRLHAYDDLKQTPRDLLDQDFGYQESPGTEAAATPALAGVIPPVRAVAAAWAQRQVNALGLGADPLAANAVTAASTAIETGLRQWGSVDGATIDDAAAAVVAVGGAFAVPPDARNIAEWAVAGVIQPALLPLPHPAPPLAPLLYVDDSLNSGGNLECAPPCQATGAALAVNGIPAGPQDYPFGRIYYGQTPGAARTYNAATRQFLEAQRVQLPLALDTDWLEVGHVDEMMSFIPCAGAQFNNWRLLLASPQRAFNLLGGCAPGAPILIGRHLDFVDGRGNNYVPVNTTCGLLNGGGLTPIRSPPTLYNAAGGVVPKGATLTGAQLRNYNLQVIQPRLNALALRLVDEIGVVPGQIIHVPVIFRPAHAVMLPPPAGGAAVATNLASALTADMVNMLVVNNFCIIPAPFGPVDPAHLNHPGLDVFEEELRGDILAANGGLQIRFINDWYTYHSRAGEIHCGTNTNRHPGGNLAAWLASPAAAWWRFNG